MRETKINWKDPLQRQQYMRQYRKIPEVKERNRQYRQRPEVKERTREYMRQYSQKPKFKELVKQYSQRPENRERMRQYSKKLRIKEKLMIIQLFGNKCVYCGCDNPAALEINHKNGGGTKEHKIVYGAAFYHKILNGERKTDDLELVCRVCNARHFMEVLKGVLGNWKIEWTRG